LTLHSYPSLTLALPFTMSWLLDIWIHIYLSVLDTLMLSLTPVNVNSPIIDDSYCMHEWGVDTLWGQFEITTQVP
jgi:hypothetical protein